MPEPQFYGDIQPGQFWYHSGTNETVRIGMVHKHLGKVEIVNMPTRIARVVTIKWLLRRFAYSHTPKPWEPGGSLTLP